MVRENHLSKEGEKKATLGSDIFGDLEDRKRVLELLDHLKTTKRLNEHQNGLTRILREGKHWSLLETVLERAKEIDEPGEEFLREVCRVMASRNIYLDARILAVSAIEHLSLRIPSDIEKKQTFNRAFLIRKMEEILEAPEPPRFHQTIVKSLQSLRENT